ncbi:MAG: N-acetylmuramoyl-L-alanine amidase [Akkermansiaceae bacterium]|nr:N-acetylmuramoyl-L-alanine amidase [Akkermansiaceae bacterium]
MKRGAPPTSAKGFLLTLTSWRTRLGRALLFSALLSLSMPPWPTKVQAGYFYDSDGDGFDDTYVPDPWEDTAYYGYTTPPSDQDGDGWEDALDPFPADARLNPQTDPDADGVPSELEWFYGMNDLDPADGAADLDGDGFSNAEAFQQGWPLDAASLAFPDADGDRLNDIIEQHWALLHPGSLDPGNPLDPVADYDQDGVMNFEELTWGLDLASPTSPATGEDLAFMQLVTGNFSAFVPPGYPGYSATDPDADGLPSLLEYQLQLNPRSADSDEDGVPDGEEDTDGDGFGNLAEVAAGTLPGQAASHPVASSPDGTGGAGAGSGSTSGTGNEQGNGTGTTGSAAPPVGGTALAATTDLHLRVRSLKVSGGTITRHSQDEWIYSSGMGTSSEEMAAMKANGWDISDAFTMDIPTGTDPDGLPTGYETRYWWTAKKQVGVAGETILPFSGRSGELASDQAVSEAYADEPGQVYQGDVSGELNLNDPASGDVFTGSEEGGGVKVVSEFAASKQSTPVSDTGLYPQGESAEVWVEGSASEVAQRRTYLILTSSTAFQAEPAWQGVGTVTFILEPGLTGVGRVEATTGAAPWVTVHNGRLWVEPPVQEGMRNEVRLLPVEVVEVSPKVTDEEGTEVAGSEKPSTGKPLTPFVEIDPYANKIAHRELKVLISSALKDKKVTWSLEALPGATPATIRGRWEDSPTHKDRFEASTAYGANGFRKVSQSSGETTVGADGHTAIRVNVPPIGFNQVRIKIQIEGMSTPIDLIDMEVPGVVVIDPGHGGASNLPGASWNNATSPSGVLEKAMALSYGTAARDALRTKRQQDKLNLRVFMTRTTDVNVSGQDRAARAKDNGADVIFIIHFNASDSHTARGTLEVVRDSGNVNATEDTNLANTVIDLMIPAIRQYDTGANKRYSVVNNTAVASDTNLGNTSAYHPIRAAYCEVEFIDLGEHTEDTSDDLVDILLNTGPNAAAVKTAVANAIRDGILQDLRNQPQP